MRSCGRSRAHRAVSGKLWPFSLELNNNVTPHSSQRTMGAIMGPFSSRDLPRALFLTGGLHARRLYAIAAHRSPPTLAMTCPNLQTSHKHQAWVMVSGARPRGQYHKPRPRLGVCQWSVVCIMIVILLAPSGIRGDFCRQSMGRADLGALAALAIIQLPQDQGGHGQTADHLATDLTSCLLSHVGNANLKIREPSCENPNSRPPLIYAEAVVTPWL